MDTNNTYTSATGTTVEVVTTGKTFKTITTFQATRHTPAEVVGKSHRTYQGVERQLRKYIK